MHEFFYKQHMAYKAWQDAIINCMANLNIWAALKTCEYSN